MKKLLPILVLATLWAAIACEEMSEPPGPPTPRWPDLTSPANVLRTVEASFNQRDIDLLIQSISPNFVFYFDPRDVGQTPPNNYLIADSWRYEWFWNAAHNMFNKAYTIDLSINTNGVGEPEPEENTYRADNIDLALLVMVDELNGFIADKGYCNFEFESYPTKERKKNWRLTNLWDRTAAVNGKSNGFKPSSLGRILAMYR